MRLCVMYHYNDYLYLHPYLRDENFRNVEKVLHSKCCKNQERPVQHPKCGSACIVHERLSLQVRLAKLQMHVCLITKQNTGCKVNPYDT